MPRHKEEWLDIVEHKTVGPLLCDQCRQPKNVFIIVKSKIRGEGRITICSGCAESFFVSGIKKIRGLSRGYGAKAHTR